MPDFLLRLDNTLPGASCRNASVWRTMHAECHLDNPLLLPCHAALAAGQRRCFSCCDCGIEHRSRSSPSSKQRPPERLASSLPPSPSLSHLLPLRQLARPEIPQGGTISSSSCAFSICWILCTALDLGRCSPPLGPGRWMPSFICRPIQLQHPQQLVASIHRTIANDDGMSNFFEVLDHRVLI